MVERRSIIHTHSKTIRLTNDELTLFVVALLNELAALLGRDELACVRVVCSARGN